MKNFNVRLQHTVLVDHQIVAKSAQEAYEQAQSRMITDGLVVNERVSGSVSVREVSEEVEESVAKGDPFK